jgi:F-type H+-transporting ATPase subunit gamma
MTSDRGLCGGFNNNLIKATERFIGEKRRAGKEVVLIPIGKKGRDYFRKKGNTRGARVDVFRKFDMTLAASISEEVIRPFIKEEYDELDIIYNEFVNVSVQRPAVVRLFPFTLKKDDLSWDRRVNYIYEPSEPALVEKILPMYVHVLIYRALLETSAGENGARMVAMDNATRNCEDLIDRLTLKYNKARQAAITAELMDIVGGTEALAKG